MERMFMNVEGKWYKAEKPYNSHTDVERANPDSLMLAALTGEPKHMIEVEVELQKLRADPSLLLRESPVVDSKE